MSAILIYRYSSGSSGVLLLLHPFRIIIVVNFHLGSMLVRLIIVLLLQHYENWTAFVKLLAMHQDIFLFLMTSEYNLFIRALTVSYGVMELSTVSLK